MKKTLMLAACFAALPMTAHGATILTGQAGGGQAFTNMQPSLVLGQYVQTANGYFPTRDGYGASRPGFLGQIRTFGYARPNFFQGAAQGSVQNLSQNTALFALLGTTYGGNGRTTFALPNLSGATMVGAGGPASGSSAGYYNVGTQFGSNSTTLTAAQMPAHDHGLSGTVDTGYAGAGQPIDNRQASLAITYGIVANGGYRFGGDGVGFIGEIQAFAGNFTPNGLLAANGQLVSINQYQALYALIGTTYGGDGQTTFALPDLAGRTAVGASTAAATTNRLEVGMGEGLGANTITLSEANLLPHVHSIPGGTNTEVAGEGQAFSTTQPSLGINYIINTQGVYPRRDETPYGEEYMLGEVTAYAGTANALPQGWSLADGSILQVRDNLALFSLLGVQFVAMAQAPLRCLICASGRSWARVRATKSPIRPDRCLAKPIRGWASPTCRLMRTCFRRSAQCLSRRAGR